MMKRHKFASKAGFTLVELLVAISLVALVSAMLSTAMSGAVREARLKRAQGELLNYGQLLQAKMNSIAFGRLNINQSPIRFQQEETPSGLGTRSNSNTVLSDSDIESNDLSRMRMLARRDFARMSLPECQADLFYPPATLQFRIDIRNSNNGVMSPSCAQISPPPAWDRMRSLLGLRTGSEIDDYMRWAELQSIIPSVPTALENPVTNPQVDAIAKLQEDDVFFKACTRKGSLAPPDTLETLTWTREYESAECLYLILATYKLTDGMAIDNVPARSIGDLDEDGVPEILDPWGEPVVFMRSPVGLEGRGLGTATSDPDPFDFLATDFRYQVSDPSQHPTYLAPVVISAGQDGEFGIRTPETIEDDFYSASAIALTDPPLPLRPISLSSGASHSRMVFRYPDPFFDVDSGVRELSHRAGNDFQNILRAKRGGGLGSTVDRDTVADNVTSIDSNI